MKMLYVLLVFLLKSLQDKKHTKSKVVMNAMAEDLKVEEGFTKF